MMLVSSVLRLNPNDLNVIQQSKKLTFVSRNCLNAPGFLPCLFAKHWQGMLSMILQKQEKTLTAAVVVHDLPVEAGILIRTRYPFSLDPMRSRLHSSVERFVLGLRVTQIRPYRVTSNAANEKSMK